MKFEPLKMELRSGLMLQGDAEEKSGGLRTINKVVMSVSAL
jgi:hypothetical protein